MKKIILILVIFPIIFIYFLNCYAADWEYITEMNGVEIYIDNDSILISGNDQKTAKFLYNPVGNRLPTFFCYRVENAMSSVVQYNFFCSERKYVGMEERCYSETDGEGELLESFKADEHYGGGSYTVKKNKKDWLFDAVCR
jgi:hypothetical protein